jgi:hypothetical protein
LKQKELYEKLRYIIKNDMENLQGNTVSEEIVFLEGRFQGYLVATDKNDTCYPFMYDRNSRYWFFSTRDLCAIHGDSIYSGGADYDIITLEKAKIIIDGILPGDKLLDEIDKYIDIQRKYRLADEWIPEYKVNETRTPSGEMVWAGKDGARYSQPLGEIIVSTYDCPCGKSTIQTTFENIPGYKDGYISVQCKECSMKYHAEYNWASGNVILRKML